MNFLDKVSNFDWTANETWKIEEELKANCFDWSSLTNFSASSEDNSPNKCDSEPTLADVRPLEHKYIPGKVFFPKNETSSLTKREQAVCLNVMLIYQSGVDLSTLTLAQKKDVALYKNLQGKIQKENIQFYEYVRKEWIKASKRCKNLQSGFYSYANTIWKNKFKHLLHYSQYYKFCSAIPLSQESPVDVFIGQNLLLMGTVAEFCPPSLLIQYQTKLNSFPATESALYNSRLSVSEDAHVLALLNNYEFDIAISASGLKRLMDNDETACEWTIPIIVKEVETKQDCGTTKRKKIVFVDKTLPKQHPNIPDFNELCHKHLVKTNFCMFSKITYPFSDYKLEDPSIDSSANADHVKKKSSTFSKKTIHYNASYDIWTIKLKNEENHLMKSRLEGKEIKFLLRSKVDATETIENIQRQVFVVPKLEYQIEYGANLPTKSELIHQWTSLFFRPYSHLYRSKRKANLINIDKQWQRCGYILRMQYQNSAVVAVESVNLQKINTEASTHYGFQPCTRLGSLYNVFLELTKLMPGNYLLHHLPKHGQFVDILKSVELTNNKTQNIYDLHSQYDIKNCSVTKTVRKWCPIDLQYVLPVHLAFKRLPGMFKPLILTDKLLERRKKAAKNKKKRIKKALKKIGGTE